MILSFSITSKLASQQNKPDPLITGQKTVTRRLWKPKASEQWCKAWDKGKRKHQAWSQCSFVKGAKKIGEFTLVERPYQQKLKYMRESDLYEEGGLWNTVDDFINMVGKGDKELVVWVVRFNNFQLD